MAETSTPRNETREVRLEDYAPPPFLVDSIDLDFDLAGDECLVTSRVALRRGPGTPAGTSLALDGTALDLVSVALHERTLSPNEYAIEDGRLVIPASLVESEEDEAAGDAPPGDDGGAPLRLTLRTRIALERARRAEVRTRAAVAAASPTTAATAAATTACDEGDGRRQHQPTGARSQHAHGAEGSDTGSAAASACAGAPIARRIASPISGSDSRSSADRPMRAAASSGSSSSIRAAW